MENAVVNWELIRDLGTRLGVAALLGALLTLHPMRLKRQLETDWDLIRAQIIITVAGALMVIVVGESAARAFALVGIGSFVRFRTVMKSPRDAAVLFILIGLGMGCGLKYYALSAVIAGFVYLMLFIVELGPVNKPKNKKDEEPPLPDEGLL